MTVINHFISGAEATGTGTDTKPVYNPATGAVSAELRLANRADLETTVAAARAAADSWGDISLAKRTAVLFKFRELVASHVEELARADHGRARQGPLRRQGRDRPRTRGHRVRLRHPAAAQGRVLGPGLHWHRRLLLPRARRRGRRHHPVQLPGHGAAVDGPDGDRHRQRLHPQALPPRAVRGDAAGQAVEAGGPARGRLPGPARRP